MRRFYLPVYLSALYAILAACPQVRSETILFESGTLGETGVPSEDVFNQVVPGANLNQFSFNGMRFELDQPTRVSRVGGHFVGAVSGGNSLFGAIIRVEDEDDFPDSTDLSTSDIVGSTVFSLPDSSALTYGEINLVLEPGWYALVFGSGLFDASGRGAALLNNEIGESSNLLGFLSGFGWGSRQSGMYFVVEGSAVPEPSSITAASVLLVLGISRIRRCRT